MGHGIGWAVKQLWGGYRVTRPGWVGCLKMMMPLPASEMSVPYIFMYVHGVGDRVPWTPSVTDLLARDWELERENETATAA